MNLISFNTSSIGASHIRTGKECQDYSLSKSAETYSIAITCDGHGGDNYFRSAVGSKFAAEIALACIDEFLLESVAAPLEKPETALIQLEKSIIASWNTRVWEHYEANPFTEDELSSVSDGRRKRLLSGKSIESTYGTTLIAIAWTQNYWFAVQIGDGKAVKINLDGSADFPIPPNEKCFLNTTTSICDIDALDNFRHYYSTDLPAALFCGSDGIDDSFIRDDQLYKLYYTIGQSFAESSYADAMQELEDYLPRLSSKGSGDDVSIAGVIDLDAARDSFPPIEKTQDHINQETSDRETGLNEEDLNNLENSLIETDSIEFGKDSTHSETELEQNENEELHPYIEGASAIENAESRLDQLELNCDPEIAQIGETPLAVLSQGLPKDMCGSEDETDMEQDGLKPGSENPEMVAQDAEPVKVCPQCGDEYLDKPNYCSNCGHHFI